MASACSSFQKTRSLSDLAEMEISPTHYLSDSRQGADDVLEYYFCVVETDLVGLSERLYMGGHETKFIPKQIRPAVIESLLIGTRGLPR